MIKPVLGTSPGIILKLVNILPCIMFALHVIAISKSMQSSENRTGEKSLAKYEWEHIFIWCLENIELWLWLCGVGLLLATLSIRESPPARQCHRLRSGKQETELSEVR